MTSCSDVMQQEGGRAGTRTLKFRDAFWSLLSCFRENMKVRIPSLQSDGGEAQGPLLTGLGEIEPRWDECLLAGLGPVNGPQTFAIYLKLFACVASRTLGLWLVARLAVSAPSLSSGETWERTSRCSLHHSGSDHNVLCLPVFWRQLNTCHKVNRFITLGH